MEPPFINTNDELKKCSQDNKKKQNYLDWDEYFMGMTFLELRKYPHKTSAALILNKRKIIISIASSCTEANRSASFVEHAEYKALSKTERGKVLYTTMFPCEHCAKALAKAGILEIIYYYDVVNCDKSKKFLEESGITVKQFLSDKTIEIDFSQYCDNDKL